MRFLPTSPIKRRIAQFFLALFLIATPPLVWAGYLQLTGNIHPVVAGELYRSAQMTPEELTTFITDNHIRSVINLRGSNPARSWYTDEIKASTAAGVTHYDIRMSAEREPDAATLAQLIEVLRTAPRPMLIHCKSGSDRTGLAAALYKLLVSETSPEVAAQELSFRYGHFPWLISKTDAMDNTFWRIAAQPQNHTEHPKPAQ